MTFIDNLRRHYLSGSLLLRLIYINVAVFLIVRLLMIVSFFGGFETGSLMQWLAVPATWVELLFKPWTLLSYQFTHSDFWHIFFNLIWFYWLGRIFMEFFTPKQLTALYILGGIAGGLMFTAACSVVPALSGAWLIGASASILAIVVATAIYTPDYRINLLFLGSVALKWVVAAYILLDLLSLDSSNMGGSIAHLGGALMGVAWGVSIKRGHDLTAWLNAFIDSLVALFSRKKAERDNAKKARPNRGNYQASTPDPVDTADEEYRSKEAKLDAALKKIKETGYSALTDEEKEILFSFSRKK